jgi:subtilisin family serine protease
MPLNLPRLLKFLLLVTVLLIADSKPAGAGAVNARLLGLAAKPDGAAEIGVIITFADRINPNSYRHLPGKNRRDALVKALRDRATNSQGELRRFLQEQGGRDIQSLWIINALACRIKPELLERIAAHPGVEEVRPDDTITSPPFQPQAAATPEWNLTAIGAPALWNLGLTGAGVVVASLDSGIDLNHADLTDKYRGGPSDWFDPYGQHATPYDAGGHGTAVKIGRASCRERV